MASNENCRSLYIREASPLQNSPPHLLDIIVQNWPFSKSSCVNSEAPKYRYI